jgi:deoxyribose-phosphate aldolase
MHISSYIDHTFLKATATGDDIRELCAEAVLYNFYAVCVNSSYVKLCHELLNSSNTRIASVTGFPLGAMDTLSKIHEAEHAIKHGAHEIDMVINLGFLKSGRYQDVEHEIRQIKQAIGGNILKVIIETCYLTEDEKRAATELPVNAGADFVKTSTGFGTGGATTEDIALMKSVTQDKIQIKASGGIRDYETAKRYIELGVTRIGTSNGIQIVTGEKSGDENY